MEWGCAIHKLQEKTLETVVVSMEGKGNFMLDQTYVDLSRVKKLSGLFLLGFNTS